MSSALKPVYRPPFRAAEMRGVGDFKQTVFERNSQQRIRHLYFQRRPATALTNHASGLGCTDLFGPCLSNGATGALSLSDLDATPYGR
ncbi:MAG: hypothetical protein B7Z55_02855 [Planctomycetales bacterium 12-60-4]|nr:MAG: hypothetical protein B7Z55_02855 [Planctomycetales bacterium 12-60-4]